MVTLALRYAGADNRTLGEIDMKAFLVAVVVAVALGIAAAMVLGTEQRVAYEAYATSGARVGDPGHNLVGPDWADRNRGG